MKIDIVSDIHLEFGDWNPKGKKTGDVLAICGDTIIIDYLRLEKVDPDKLKHAYYTQILANDFRNFFKNVSEEYPHTLLILGNHEYYRGKWPKSVDVLRDELTMYPNIHLLNDDFIVLDNVVFIGSTLWSDCNKSDPITMHFLNERINDYGSITNSEKGYTKLRPHHTIEQHKKSLKYIKSVLNVFDNKKCVVLTHHSPSFNSCIDSFRDDYLMNGAFHSNLDEFILDHPQISLWAHGHTHNTCDYHIGDTRIICNARGYVEKERQSDELEPYFPLMVEV